MTKHKKLNKLRQLLDITWDIKDINGKRNGYDILSNIALSINQTVQDTENDYRVKELSWKLHIRITDEKVINLPTIDVKTIYSNLKYGLDQLLTNLEGGL